MFNWNIDDARWINTPQEYKFSEGKVSFKTEAHTDFWQRTNYGYQTDNGHALVMPTDEKYFTFTVKAEFVGEKLYDQCGIIVYQSSEDWMKAGLENESAQRKMLSSVVTNNGYSDWAISGFSDDKNAVMYFRLSRKNTDFLFEVSKDGKKFDQMRIFHLFKGDDRIRFGIYACSPLASSFEVVFSEYKITECVWSKETHI